jgi:hypothetical protein
VICVVFKLLSRGAAFKIFLCSKQFLRAVAFKGFGAVDR